MLSAKKREHGTQNTQLDSWCLHGTLNTQLDSKREYGTLNKQLDSKREYDTSNKQLVSVSAKTMTRWIANESVA